MSVYAGRTIVLTGASAGIGAALAKALAGQGPRLVLAARDEARLQAVAAECGRLGAETLVVKTDVAAEADCRALVERTVERFSSLDVLVNNAGMGSLARFEDVNDLAPFEQLMRVNYLSCVYLAHHALPHLIRSRGQIVAVASMAGLMGVPTRTAYCASKHAMIGFHDALRIELRERGVAVTVVCPDFVQSEIRQRALGRDGRPLGESPVHEADVMTAERCAELMVDAMERRKRLYVMSGRGRLGRALRVVLPGLVDGMVEKAVARGR